MHGCIRSGGVTTIALLFCGTHSRLFQFLATLALSIHVSITFVQNKYNTATIKTTAKFRFRRRLLAMSRSRYRAIGFLDRCQIHFALSLILCDFQSTQKRSDNQAGPKGRFLTPEFRSERLLSLTGSRIPVPEKQCAGFTSVFQAGR